MSKYLLVGALLSSVIVMGAPVHAEERMSHYKGLPAETLEAAVGNFSEYNHKLEALLGKGELSAEDLAAVHEITYTLENALVKINAEFMALADTLEEVHVASETADTATVVNKGREYLRVSRQVID